MFAPVLALVCLVAVPGRLTLAAHLELVVARPTLCAHPFYGPMAHSQGSSVAVRHNPKVLGQNHYREATGVVLSARACVVSVLCPLRPETCWLVSVMFAFSFKLRNRGIM